MKGKLLAFASILCIVSLMASGANAGKPDKPGNHGKTQTESIVVTGDLAGGQEVEGCCPNAGPFPEYTLTLTKNLTFADGTHFAAGPYDGHVFMNDDKFQFWTEGWPNNHICIEIYGGEIYKDKKNKTLTVIFDDVEWNVMHEPKKVPLQKLSFVLTRSRI